jgi:hypothetical protein
MGGRFSRQQLMIFHRKGRKERQGKIGLGIWNLNLLRLHFRPTCAEVYFAEGKDPRTMKNKDQSNHFRHSFATFAYFAVNRFLADC